MIEIGTLVECSHLLDDYNPINYFNRLLRDNPQHNNELTISQFLRGIAMRTEREPGRVELIEEAIKLNERVKIERLEKSYNDFTLALALRTIGDLKRAEKYVERLREGLRKYSNESYFYAYHLAICHSIFNEIDETDKLINIIKKIAQKGEEDPIIMLALSSGISYFFTKEEKYLNIALESFHKLKGDTKVGVGIRLMSIVDKLSIMFDIIKEITAEKEFLYHIDEFISSLGKIYANTKNEQIIKIVETPIFSHSLPGFFINMAGYSLSKNFRIALSFW